MLNSQKSPFAGEPVWVTGKESASSQTVGNPCSAFLGVDLWKNLQIIWYQRAKPPPFLFGVWRWHIQGDEGREALPDPTSQSSLRNPRGWIRVPQWLWPFQGVSSQLQPCPGSLGAFCGKWIPARTKVASPTWPRCLWGSNLCLRNCCVPSWVQHPWNYKIFSLCCNK